MCIIKIFFNFTQSILATIWVDNPSTDISLKLFVNGA